MARHTCWPITKTTNLGSHLFYGFRTSEATQRTTANVAADGLPAVIAHHEARLLFFDGPRWREAAGGNGLFCYSCTVADHVVSRAGDQSDRIDGF